MTKQVCPNNTVGVMMINIQAAWVGFLLGCLAGVIPGLFFTTATGSGGYASWQRRMIRLAHIASSALASSISHSP